MSPPSCLILAAGGHARVVIESLRASGAADLVGILEANEALWGREVLGVRVLGGDELLRNLAGAGADSFVVGVGSTGDNGPRRRLYDAAVSAGLRPLTVIDPSALRSASAWLGPGCQLLPRSVVNAGVVLGANVIVNTGAIVEHDCRVGDHVHVATGAVLASTVEIGDGAHVGAGATVRQCVAIGARALVGAGAVVVKNVAPDSVVVGVPARPLQRATKPSGEAP